MNYRWISKSKTIYYSYSTLETEFKSDSLFEGIILAVGLHVAFFVILVGNIDERNT